MSCPSEEINLQSALAFFHLDDISFNLILYELTHGPVHFDPNRLELLLFNPTEQAEIPHSYSNYIDPDINFPFRPAISNYMVEETVNDQVISLTPNITFSLMHLNARSLIGNFDKLKLLLANLQKPFSG